MQKKFDFSVGSMGTSYAQLTVAEGSNKYVRNDYKNFSGMVIGLLQGNSRNDKLSEFALENNFTYTSAIFNTQDELYAALKDGKVDAVLTSSLRKIKNERIISQFAPSPFYAIVKKGDTEFLNEIDNALESVEMSNPAFKYNLYQKHYRTGISDTFVLSRGEMEYLKSNPVVRAAVRTGAAPISDWENGKYQGISADVMEYLLGDLGIKIEYIVPKSRKDSYEMLTDGRADIVCLFESDHNLAEEYNTRITTPYLDVSFSAITRQRPNMQIKNIAVSDDSFSGIMYAKSNYPQIPLYVVKTNFDAMKAVSKGDADIAFINTYSAEKELVHFSNIRATFISDLNRQYSVGVSQSTDDRFYSILDKKINSMNSEIINDILFKQTMFNQSNISLTDYFRQNPIQVLVAAAAFFAMVIVILSYIAYINRKYANKIYNLAYIDKQTNMWNMNGFINQGATLMEKHPMKLYVVAEIDLENFSRINDNYGRKAGDDIILEMGKILNGFKCEKTVVAHRSADHFLLLLGYDSKEEMHVTLTEIADSLKVYYIEDSPVKFIIHVGVGMVEKEEQAITKAIDHARIAKNEIGKAGGIIYLDDTLQMRLQKEKEIRDHVECALENKEFKVYYQPKIDMTTGKFIGAEALVRWDHRKLGFLNPLEFIPVLEHSGSITDVDFYVLEESCKLVRKWIDAGFKPITLSVNQSRAHFLKADYFDKLEKMLKKYEIPPRTIELEITETLFGQEMISNETIKKMKEIGLQISMDDFGAGYSSLYLLHQISVDILKIDKGLLDESTNEKKVKNIIHRVVQIASDLGLSVICEGVETIEQAEFLMGIGCNFAQGFLYSKPLPQEEFENAVINDASKV